jgi:hypothetical protein
MIKPCEPRMYVILREDLSMKYVQGAHGLAQYAMEFPQGFKKWNNEYLIFLSVFNGLALDELNNTLFENKFAFSQFVEPDLKSDLPTALCLFEDGSGVVSRELRSLKLATK